MSFVSADADVSAWKSMRWIRGLALALSSAVLMGCSDSGPPRFRLDGTVDFDGKPVPSGTIYFEPDGKKGNKGPQGKAAIVNGKFDTQAEGGMGHIGGPTVIRILGYAKAPNPGSDEPIEQLFPEYVESVELDKKEGSRGFLIPKDYQTPAAATGPKPGDP